MQADLKVISLTVDDARKIMTHHVDFYYPKSHVRIKLVVLGGENQLNGVRQPA